MKKSKIIFKYKYLFITILLVIYSLLFNYYNKFNSKYNIDDNNITGYITYYLIDGNKLSLKIKAKEVIICTYYFKDEDELNNFKDNYELGDTINLIGELSRPNNNTVFNLFNYKEYLKYENINYILNISEYKKIKDNNKIRYKIKNKIVNYINKNQNKEYLYTFILGNYKYIDSNVLESYRFNGVIHLFSVSGVHVSIVSLIILKIFSKFKFKNILVILVLLFYIFLTDFSPPMIRSSLFFILLFINKKYKLNISNINIMLILLSILIIYDPYIIFKIGFQYSYIISFYLILFSKIISRGKNNIIKLFLTSFISFLSSFPITISNFFSINLFSIILNIFFVPFISSIIFPLSLITVVCPLLNNILSLLIIILEKLSLLSSSFTYLSFTMPKVNILIIIFYYIFITYMLYKILNNKYKEIIVFILIVFIHSNLIYFNNKKEITFIDVGQGDSILIKMPYNTSNILIDTGGKESYYNEDWSERNSSFSIGKDTVCMYLKSVGIKKLNYLILTHGDMDHLGEAINVIDCINVDNVIFNYGNINDNEKRVINVLKDKNINYYFYKSGNNIKTYNYYLDFISPIKDYNDENDNGLVIYLNIDNNRFLFTADISKKVEEDIIKNNNLKIDVLKVAHHGSKTSSSIDFLNNINPKYSIISVGLKNNFNHPSLITLDNLNKINSKTYKTSIDGSIKIIINNKLDIITSNP